MNPSFFLSNPLPFSCENFEDYSSLSTIDPKSPLYPSHLCEKERRIMSWLEENGVFHAVPEEKQHEYYEKCRKSAHETKEHSLRGNGLKESPLLQRRRNSLPNKKIESPKIGLSLKLSKFRTCKCIEAQCFCGLVKK